MFSYGAYAEDDKYYAVFLSKFGAFALFAAVHCSTGFLLRILI